jgi:hypothetical protein
MLLSNVRSLLGTSWLLIRDESQSLLLTIARTASVVADPVVRLAQQPETGAILRAVMLGPLAGGVFYVWLVVTIPFIYIFGAGPAFMSGALFSMWLRAQPLVRWPGPWEIRIVAGLLAIPGTFLYAVILVLADTTTLSSRFTSKMVSLLNDGMSWLLVAHAVWGAVLCANFIARRFRNRLQQQALDRLAT